MHNISTIMDIRAAHRADLAGIYQLVLDLATFEKEPDAVKAELADYETAYDEGLIDAIVAQDGTEIVGAALFYMTFSTWKGKMLYLEDFYVDPSYRSKGVGQKIFDRYLETAKSRGCTMVKWQVLDWNVNAINFYKKNGATIEKQWYNGKIIF